MSIEPLGSVTSGAVDPTKNAATSTSPSLAKDGEAKAVISSDFETFLKMLTTQLENQDPLDPVKSEDFAVQLATFSGVEQQVLTNDLLEKLLQENGLSGINQYANWIGMEARASAAAQFNGDPITVTVRPDKAADKAVLLATNEAGRVVQRIDIPVSENAVQWTGAADGVSLPNGIYKFSVESYRNGIAYQTDEVEVYSKITEARAEGSSTILVMSGGVEIDASKVTGLRDGG